MPLAADAPLCYLPYRDLQRFQDVDRLVADAVLTVLRRHTVYLWPETVVLALLSQPKTAEPEDAPSCVSKATDVSWLADWRLADLVTDVSWLLFQLLQLNPRSLLEQPVSAWEDDDGYRSFRDFVRNLNVTNNATEGRRHY